MVRLNIIKIINSSIIALSSQNKRNILFLFIFLDENIPFFRKLLIEESVTAGRLSSADERINFFYSN